MTEPAAELPTLLPALESLDDAALQEILRRAGELLREREHARQRDAIERARAILAGAGLSVQDMLGGTGRGAAGGKAGRRTGADGYAGSTSAAPRKGARYANPDNPAQIHERGRGREPNRFKALRERGELAEPLE